MADIVFQCPKCKQHLKIDVGYARTEILCPSCSRNIMVPTMKEPICVVQPPQQSSRSKSSIKKWIGVGTSSFLVVCVVFGVWYYGVHLPDKEKVAKAQFADQLREKQQREKTERDEQLVREQELQHQRLQEQTKIQTALKRANQLQLLRDGDKQTMDRYINLVANRLDQYQYAAVTKALSFPLTSVNEDMVACAVVGDNQKILEITQFVRDKLSINGLNNPAIGRVTEAGCIGHSDLWVFRDKVSLGVPMCEIFLLRDLDPTSGAVITRTDRSTGRQTFLARFKCTNNKERCVLFPTLRFYENFFYSPELKDTVELLCEDEDDAKRVGKGMAALILAYGGKDELIDSSDSFSTPSPR